MKILKIFFALSIVLQIVYANEILKIQSANPFGFKNIIDGLDDEKKQTVEGVLKYPQGNGPFPIVVGLAGSNNWSEHHLDYMELYRDAGIATLELQSFASRGVTSTVGSQISVTTAMMILDAYRSLEALSKNPKIDVNRAAITGWSLGGGVALYAGWKPLYQAITKKFTFAAHLSIYPPCLVEPLTIDFTSSPMHILIGAEDDWTPAIACEDLVPKMIASGTNIGIEVYANSHHSFDNNASIKFHENAYSTTDCRFKMKDDGTILMDFLSLPMSTPLLQKIGLGLCAKRGTTTEGNLESRAKALKFAQEFMKNNLLQ